MNRLPLPQPVSGVVYIYTLAHPMTGEIRYVGKSVDPIGRFRNHMRCTSKTRSANWILSLKKQGLAPVMEIVDVVTDDDWQFWEIYWIHQFKAWSLNLTNLDYSCQGAGRASIETRTKLSLARKMLLATKNLSTETRAKMSLAHKGKTHNTETRDKISQASKNRSAETRAKMSLANKGRTISPETRAKMSLANKGKTHSAESRAKMSLARKANPCISKAIQVLTPTGEVLGRWSSITGAAEYFGVSRTTIQRSLNGKPTTFKRGHTAIYAAAQNVG